MEALIDPIHIVVIGGHGVGKTTLLSRLTSFQAVPFESNYSYTQTQAQTHTVSCFSFLLPLNCPIPSSSNNSSSSRSGNSNSNSNINSKNSSSGGGSNALCVKLFLYELPSDYLLCDPSALPAPLQLLLRRCEGALVVTDPLRAVCATWTDAALDLLRAFPHIYTHSHTFASEDSSSSSSSSLPAPHYLLVNKMDISLSHHVISAEQLDLFVGQCDTQLQGWFYTVGHPDLGDFDCGRGCSLKQKPIEDILRKLILVIFRNRHHQLHKLLPVPLSIRFEEWKHIDVVDFIHLL